MLAPLLADRERCLALCPVPDEPRAPPRSSNRDAVSLGSLKHRFASWLSDTAIRTPEVRRAFAEVVIARTPGEICVSVGGGPGRPDARLRNLNIALAANVDLVGDAHALPLADGSVDAIYCEAVLEHLEDPQRAVREMWRVLKPGGQVLAVTPFLQVYHQFPDHFQNFTATGHARLFTATGFALVASGVAVGPTYAWLDVTQNYLRVLLPNRLVGGLVARFFAVVTLPLRSIDRWLASRPAGLIMPSTTFVQARKPTLGEGQPGASGGSA